MLSATWPRQSLDARRRPACPAEARFAAAKPHVTFLCAALDVPF